MHDIDVQYAIVAANHQSGMQKPVPHVSFDRRTLQPKPAAQCGEIRQKLPVIVALSLFQ